MKKRFVLLMSLAGAACQTTAASPQLGDYHATAANHYSQCPDWPIQTAANVNPINVRMRVTYRPDGTPEQIEDLNPPRGGTVNDQLRAEAAVLFTAAFLRCGPVPFPAKHYAEWRSVDYALSY